MFALWSLTKRAFLLGTFILLASAFPVVAQQVVSDFACKILTATDTDRGFQASAFVVGANDKELLCVTAAHAIVPGEKELTVVWQDGNQQTGKILSVNNDRDLAAFSLPLQGNRIPVVLGDVDEKNGPFRGFGFPANEDLRRIDGDLIDTDNDQFSFKEASIPGMSGGPVRDKNGQTVGLIIKGNTKLNRSVAVRGKTIQDFISPFVGGVVRITDTQNPGDRDVALRRTRVACNSNFNVLNQPPRFNVGYVNNNVHAVNNNNNVNNNDVNAELQAQLDVLTLQLQAMQNNNIYNNNNNNLYGGNNNPTPVPAPTPGDKGDKGDQGEQGPPGEPGKVDIDAVVLAVTQKLKPITVNFQDGTGNPASVQSVPLGGILNIPPVKLWWTDLKGNILKQAKPLGDALKAQNVEVNKKPK